MENWAIKAPVIINWTLSNRCSFNCSHCYSRDDVSDELPLNLILEGIDRSAEWGVLSINFGGGEPLLFGSLLDVIRYAADKGLRVSLNSNGYLLDIDMAKKLAQAHVSSVGISIDSHTPQVHDLFRNVPNSHNRAVHALANLKKAGVESTISTVICRINHEYPEEMINLAVSTGASKINFHNFKCVGNGLNNREELDLTPDEWRTFYKRVIELRDRYPVKTGFDDPVISSLGAAPESFSVKGSICGKLSLAVKSNGDITPCGFIPHVIGNILKDDLDKLWHQSPVLASLRGKKAKGKCIGCGHYDSCIGGCSARAFAVAGDFNEPDPHCWER